jgi:hypothetical protein
MLTGASGADRLASDRQGNAKLRFSNGRSRTLGHQQVETTIYSLASAAPERPDRRSGERYLSLLRVGAILVEGRREFCLIRNISAGGMMIRAYSAIPVGTALSIELKHGDPLSGIVRWVENGLTGVAFDTAVDVVGLLAPSAGGPRPRLPRVEVDAPLSIREDGKSIRARALNISQGGICIESPADLSPHGDVVVSLAGLTPAAGVVKWKSGISYGIAFNRALPLGELVAWLQDQQEQEQRRSATA